jgi:hypothetical protein
VSVWDWDISGVVQHLDNVCVECIRFHLGWNIFIKRERLDRLDKDGRQGIVLVDFDINPLLPLNKAMFSFAGSDVCLKHVPVMPNHVTDGKQHSSGSKLLQAQAVPPGFMKAG